ncbi:MAG: Outer membrane protein transport protein (OMPP1/FadL/TodX) [Elusimicrobia bacterium ADurb.Bin231]|nr:MAG: Outer membrane protein transport protein (OMPP1/FadL/TodX) [Elusimicrobia bacterium ADurb.Bin231]
MKIQFQRTILRLLKNSYVQSFFHYISVSFYCAIVAVCLMSFISASLEAYSSIGSFWKWGDPQRGFSARSVAMGGTGIASMQEAASLYVNPALTNFGEGKGFFTISPSVITFFDKRDHAYQSKDYVTTNDMYSQFDCASVLWSASRRNDIILGFGYFSDLNFDYALEEKISGQTDRILSAGDFHNWVFGGSWKIDSWLSVGMAYMWGRGKHEKDFTLITETIGGNLVDKTSDYMTLSGDSLILGGNVVIDESINLGIFWRSNFDMTVKEKNYMCSTAPYSAVYTREFPYQLGFGLNYKFNDEKNSIFVFDFIFSNWADSNYYRTKTNGVSITKVKEDPLFENVTEFRFGFEHTPIEKLDFRYGFSYMPDYAASYDAMPAFSFGLGTVIEKTAVDIAFEYAARTSNQQRISQISSGIDTVKESRARVALALSYKW